MPTFRHKVKGIRKTSIPKSSKDKITVIHDDTGGEDKASVELGQREKQKASTARKKNLRIWE